MNIFDSRQLQKGITIRRRREYELNFTLESLSIDTLLQKETGVVQNYQM